MTLQETIELRETLSAKERIRIANELTVLRNILTGAYHNEAFPLDVAQEDLDLLNGDKML